LQSINAVEVAPAHVRSHPQLILQVEEKNKNQSINAVEVAPAHVRRHPHLVLQVEERKKKSLQSINAVEVAPAHVCRHPHLVLQVEEKKKNLCNQSMLLRWRPLMYAAILTSSYKLKKKIVERLFTVRGQSYHSRLPKY
jgi:hypothetical protein